MGLIPITAFLCRIRRFFGQSGLAGLLLVVFAHTEAVASPAPVPTPKPATCAANFAGLTEEIHALKPFSFSATRGNGGTVNLDWSDLKERLRAALPVANRGAKDPVPSPTRLRVLVDNKVVKEVPIDTDRLTLPLDPNEQYSVRVEAVSDGGRVVERTEHAILEKTSIRSVNPASYAGEPAFRARSSLDRKLGIDSEMPEVVQWIGRRKVVYVWKNPSDPRIKSLRGEVDFRVLRDEKGKILGYAATDGNREKNGLPPLRFGPDEAFVKVDAAFNENSFLWDDMFTCLHVTNFDPELCRSTVEFWLDVQKNHSQGLGDIPREVLKSNGTSFNVYETVHLGRKIPNGSYGNPNIMGDVVENLVDQTGLTPENRDLMKRTVGSMKAYGKWLDGHRAIRDKKGKLLGYWISDLGSGMDNIGRAPGDNFSATAFVDELARRIELEKSSARIQARLGDFAGAKRSEQKAAELDRLLNERYWSKEKGFYYDLVPGPGGKMVRQEDMPTVAGFWPLFSRSASPEQINRIVKDWYTKDTFGGDFPVRSLPPIMEKLRPGSYHADGGYWRGGNWAPTDVMKALGEERSGRPDLAAQTIRKKLAADTQLSNRQVAAGKTKTVFETMGTDEQGRVIPGVQVEPDGRVHQTRSDFVGWGGTPHTFGKLRNLLGIRPVGAFGGGSSQLDEWIRYSTESPAFRNSSYFAQNPRRLDPAQKALYGEGYLEINLPFDPGKEGVEVSGYHYRGEPVSLKVESLGQRNGKPVVRVTISADGPVDMNLAVNQLFGGAGGNPRASSPILKAKTKRAGAVTLEFALE